MESMRLGSKYRKYSRRISGPRISFCQSAIKWARAQSPIPFEQVLLVLALTLGLSGCAALKGFPERPTDIQNDLSTLSEHLDAAKVKDCLEADAGAQETCRDQLVAARMYVIDLQFSEFEETLFRQTRESGFAATLATLGLTTGAALASGGTSQALSGTAALIIGGREAFQKEVLAERTLVAIHTAMRAGRATVGLRIREGIRQPINSYPLAAALSDLHAYFDAGTLLGALVGITESVGATALTKERQLDNVSRGLTREGQPTIATPPPSTKIDNAVTENERRLSRSDGETIQKALCVESDGDFGGSKSKTRAAISLFQAAISSEAGDRTGKLDNQNQVNILLGAEACTNPPYRNAYEKFEYATEPKIKELQTLLSVAVTGKWDDPIRAEIKKRNKADLGIDNSDAVTPELVEKISP